jgi:hypothetical protein
VAPRALLRAELTGGHPTSSGFLSLAVVPLLLVTLHGGGGPSSKSGSVAAAAAAACWNASPNPLFPRARESDDELLTLLSSSPATLGGASPSSSSMLSSGLMTRVAKAVDSDGSRSNDLLLVQGRSRRA